MTDPGCGTHAGLGAELRAVAVLALDRLGPLLDRLRAGPATAAPAGSPCAVCPVCALVAVLRGDRPELAVRLAEQAAGLLAVLQAALDEGDPGAWSAPASQAPAPQESDLQPPARRVQHIRIERPAPTRC